MGVGNDRKSHTDVCSSSRRLSGPSNLSPLGVSWPKLCRRSGQLVGGCMGSKAGSVAIGQPATVLENKRSGHWLILLYGSIVSIATYDENGPRAAWLSATSHADVNGRGNESS